jgi:hypothetical protein
MGFAFLHRYIFGDIIHPINNYVQGSEKTCSISIDCTGLLFKISYAVLSDVIIENPDSLLDLLVENVSYILKIIKEITNINDLSSVNLFFDGKSPKHKIVLQKKRDEYIKRQIIGLGSIKDRNLRSSIVSYIAKHVVQRIIQEHGKLNIYLSSTEEPGEADIKIVKKLMHSNSSELEIIITTDTDIFISLNSLRTKKTLVIIWLPRVGLHCLTSCSLNSWLQNNSFSYEGLLFYFIFFCGNDYECPIVSGTKNQIISIYEFGKKHRFIVSIKHLLALWSKLNIKPTRSVVITGLSYKVLCQIIYTKMKSVQQSLEYYSFGYDLPPNHISLLSVYSKWVLLLKNIKPKEINNYLKEEI